MCGIAGYFLPDSPPSAPSLEMMCGLIRHRGPDDEGYRVDGGCGLGMRRLSIIDLATGHQPISNEDGSMWIVFNGEIYDFAPLRETLTRQRHRFTTKTDTEVILHLYEQEGIEGIQKLRGMFAFAIWDARRRELVLARDRFGKKPLYYAVQPNGIYFGSELKCLRAAGVPLDLDEEALRLYFQFSYIPDPWSPYRAIRKLAPGSWLTMDATGTVRQGVYWRQPPPVSAPAPGDTPEKASERIRRAFDDAVRVRMIADVPLGAFLSGGIDSASVVASMAQQSTEPVKTFSIGFEEREFNELPYASLVAQKFKTDHHEIVVGPASVDLLTRLVDHFDEPFGDSSAIPTFLVSEFAAQHVKVALTGDGGDELFAGYDRILAAQRLQSWDGVPVALRRMGSNLAAILPYSAYGKNYLQMVSRESGMERYFENNYAPYFLRKRLLEPHWMSPADDAYFTHALARYLPSRETQIIAQALYFESTSNLPGDILVKVDRMSMANSLEVRCPLVDHQLAEVASGCPPEWNLRGGRGKQLFLNAVGDRLPAKLLSRPKQGFGIPLARWFRGPLRSVLRDQLASAQFLGRGLVNASFLNALIDEHESGRRDNSHWLWQLLMLELWFRQHDEAVGRAG
jgi:asparagine synthase (glutamine-hydrolysing)